MKVRVKMIWSLVTGSWLLAGLLLYGAETKFALPRETARLKPGEGMALVNSQCVLCHSVDYISTQPRLNAAQWKAAVLKMQSKYGASISTNNVDALVGYLVEAYGSKSPVAK